MGVGTEKGVWYSVDPSPLEVCSQNRFEILFYFETVFIYSFILFQPLAFRLESTEALSSQF